MRISSGYDERSISAGLDPDDRRLGIPMQKLDRILERDHQPTRMLVDMADEGGEHRTAAQPLRTLDDHDPATLQHDAAEPSGRPRPSSVGTSEGRSRSATLKLPR